MGLLSEIVDGQRRRFFLSYRRSTASAASAAVRDYLQHIGFAVSVFRFEDAPKDDALLELELAHEISAADHHLVIVGTLDDLNAYWMAVEDRLHEKYGHDSCPVYLFTRSCIQQVGHVPFGDMVTAVSGISDRTLLYDIDNFNYWLELMKQSPPRGLSTRQYFHLSPVATVAAIRGHPLEEFFFWRRQWALTASRSMIRCYSWLKWLA